MNKDKIWLSSPHMGENEQKYVQEAFETNWIAPLGPHVNAFEEAVQNFTTAKHAAALSSGTAAIHLALILLGVKEGDVVICQSMTFSASANPIAYQRAIPVFVDSEKESWNMCPNALEDAIQNCVNGKEVNGIKLKKPKAIIPVHLYGMPANMKAIAEIANRYEIPIIEDAAEALGSTFEGKNCGSFGEFGILSFNGNKIITTSGGGALISDNQKHIENARFLATQARDAAPHYQHSQIGYNYRMSNVLAGIGRGQMEVLPDRIAARRANYKRYEAFFKDVEGVQMQNEPSSTYYSNRWLTSILFTENKKEKNRESLRLALEAENIEARPLWKPMHLQPIFEKYPYFGGTQANDLFQKGLCLPSGSNLGESDFERIFEVLQGFFLESK